MDPLIVAEDAAAYLVPRRSEVRLVADDVVLSHNPDPLPWAGSAVRVRFTPETVDRRIDEVRAWFAAQGRVKFAWCVGPSATPDDFVGRLLARGAVLDPDEPYSTAMILDHEPPPAPGDIEVRPIGSLEDYASMKEIMFDAYDMSEEQRTATRALLAEAWAETQLDGRRVLYLASVDGDPVSYGQLIRLEEGSLLLGGGATVPRARGRGAYRALVRARWDEAVRLGAPVLITEASDLSRPILERLGFRGTARIVNLIDNAR